MTSTTTSTTSDSSASFARAGLLSLAGAAISAMLGFTVNYVFARSLGDEGYGIVLQAVAVFSIALSFGKLGMDSAAVWVCGRHEALADHELRSAVRFMLGCAAVGSGVAAILVIGAGVNLRGSSTEETARIGTALVAVGWALPFAALVLVSLAASRGLGAIKPFVFLGSIGMPALRVAGIVVAAWAGWSVAGHALVWAAPTAIIMLLALPVLRRQMRSARSGPGAGGEFSAGRREISRYAVGRTISAGLEQGLLFIDVVLVGAVAGSAAAGVYGGASRFVAAGLIADVAIRVVVSPQFSSLIQRRDFDQLKALYRLSAVWLVLLSAPVYLTLAVFGPTVLGWLGPEFVDGSTALAILAVATALTLAMGNIHSVLIMAGHSGLAALNKGVVLSVNVAGNLALVPWLGIEGAAVAWAASMLLDAGLATYQVRRFVGVNAQSAAIFYPLLIACSTFGAVALAVRATWGTTTPALLVSVAVAAVPFTGWCALDRRRLGLDNLSAVVRRRQPG